MLRQTETYDLEAGVLTLTTPVREGPDLFRIAERVNPKRAFLFVSTILGRHIPVDPKEHRAVLQQLAQKVSAYLLSGPVFVMGFAETAVGIGAGVFDCLRLSDPEREMGYLTTTRFAPAGAQEWFRIEESHSHAVDHLIFKPGPGVLHSGPDATLVIVDDEATTGATFAQLAAGLKAQGLTFGRLVLVTLTDWSDGKAGDAVGGIFEDADIFSVTAQNGTWSWTPDRTKKPRALPGACDPSVAAWIPSSVQEFAAPRLGLSSRDARQSGRDILSILQHNGFELPADGDRVLVVGAGEHVWQPMLAAEALGERGFYTRFITTTRSPILPGDTIRHKLSFPDHYGQGFWMYMHNVVPSDWDRILFFTETGADGLCDTLLSALGQIDVIDGAGAISILKPTEGKP